MANKKGTNVYAGYGLIDWSQVAGNVDFALIRAGFDDSAFPDGAYFETQWVNNYTGAIANNIPYGVWWFCYALTPAIARSSGEAVGQYLIDHNLTPTYPIYYDVESSGDPRYPGSVETWQQAGITVTPQFVQSIIEAWCSGVESKGFATGVYFNQGMYYAYDYASMFARHPNWSYWLAQWNSPTPTWIDWDFWQYSSGDLDTNIIPGINASVDLDYLKDGYVPPGPGPGPTPTPSGKMPFWFYLKYPF